MVLSPGRAHSVPMTSRAPQTNASTSPSGRRPRVSRRWAVPAVAVLGVAAVTGGAVAAPQVAQALSGNLPSRTPEQLLAAVASAGARPMSGTVVETADLGLPALPGSGSSTSLTSLVSGSHTVRLWYGSATQQRIAVLGDLAETDVVRNGAQAWVWSSSSNSAQRLLLPTEAAASRTAPTPDPTADPARAAAELTPAAAAARAVAAVTPTTRLSVDPTVRVAGRQAYQLVMQPRDAGSLVDRVTVAVDATTSVPLRVEVYAVGRGTAAFSTAFTSLTVAQPDASVFAFNPPAGSTVTTKDLRGALADRTPAEAGKAAAKRPASAAPVVTGRGWASVVTIKGVQLGAKSGTAADASPLSAITRAATPVSGAFGSGRVLSTRLLSALLLDDGRLLVGAVTPATLERAAAR